MSEIDDVGTLRAIAWSELCPWLNIFRTFRLAVSFRVVLLAAAAAFLTLTGWAIVALIFSGSPQSIRWMGPHAKRPWVAMNEMVPDNPGLPPPGPAGAVREVPAAEAMPAEATPPDSADHARSTAVTFRRAGPLVGPWAELSWPLLEVFFNPKVTVTGAACLLLCGLWGLAVWAFFGAVITRIVALQLARDEQVSTGAALRHARSKWPAYFGAPLFPVVGILAAAVPIWLLSLLLNANVGVLLLSPLWVLLLAFGLIMSILLLGLIFGWPLMWATISAEGTDTFDALQRSYSYVFQRPLHYLFYVFVAAVLGWLGWLLVKTFAAAVVGLTYWAAGWACGGERIAAIADPNETLGALGGAGAAVIGFWVGCVKLLAVGFYYGYFWTATTAIYFLLRRDIDATEMDEVFLDADEDEQAYGLPPLGTDQAGAPAVEDEVPEVEPDDSQPPDQQ